MARTMNRPQGFSKGWRNQLGRRVWLLGVWLAHGLCQAGAELRVDSSLFDADVAQLQRTVPNLKKVAKPRWGPGGLRGLWTADAVRIGGYAFTPVFYVRDGRVRRLEYRWESDAHPCLAAAVFDDAVRDISNQWGNPAASGTDAQPEPDGAGAIKSTFWSANATDLLAYVQDTNLRCSVLLVNRPQQLRDAGSL